MTTKRESKFFFILSSLRTVGSGQCAVTPVSCFGGHRPSAIRHRYRHCHFKTSVIDLPIHPLGAWICSSAARVAEISVIFVWRDVLPCLIPQPIQTNGICAS